MRQYRTYGPCSSCQLVHVDRDRCFEPPPDSVPTPRDDSRDWPTWPVLVLVVMAALLMEVCCAGCWTGTCPPAREPEFVYVVSSREPATCRALSRWMRRMPIEDQRVDCSSSLMTYDWCMYSHEYNYAWNLRQWVLEVIAACREDGDGPPVDL